MDDFKTTLEDVTLTYVLLTLVAQTVLFILKLCGLISWITALIPLISFYAVVLIVALVFLFIRLIERIKTFLEHLDIDKNS